MSDPSIGILITSRNNYALFDEIWAPRAKDNNDVARYSFLNIDEDSSPEEKEYGKKSCDKHGIKYMDREGRGMHHNLLTAANYFEPKGIKYILWFQSDSWPLQPNFYNSFDKLCASGGLDEFGVIGFHGLAQNILEEDRYRKMLKQLKKGKRPTGVIGRSQIENGDPWYCGVASRRIGKPLKKPELFWKPFSVQSVAWFGAAIGVDQLRKNIDINHKFYFHRSWDDIAFQFLVKNIHNIVLPTYYIDHRPDLKPSVNLPERSVRFAYKGNDRYHSLVGFKDEGWIKQWGWDFNKRKTFEKVRDRYRGTLAEKFYLHDRQNGPLKSFDIEGSEYEKSTVS